MIVNNQLTIGISELTPLQKRFLAKVDQSQDCWLWTAATSGGYGCFWFEGRMQRAHRISYRLFVGEIEEGLEIHHECDVKLCVNPSHLMLTNHRTHTTFHLGTNYNAVKTHCPNGHPYDDENTLSVNGKRQCRICNRKRRREYRERTGW